MRYLCPYIPTVRIFFWKAIDQASTFRKRTLCALEHYFNWNIKIYTDSSGQNKGDAALVYEDPSAAHSAGGFYNGMGAQYSYLLSVLKYITFYWQNQV